MAKSQVGMKRGPNRAPQDESPELQHMQRKNSPQDNLPWFLNNPRNKSTFAK